MIFRLIFCAGLLGSCQFSPGGDSKSANSATVLPQKNDRQLSSFFKKTTAPDFLFLKTDPGLGRAIFHQTLFLEKNGRSESARLVKGITERDLTASLGLLQNWQGLTAVFLRKYFDFYQLQTGLEEEKSLVTGYCTPIFDASRRREKGFAVPVFRKPPDSNPMPTRSQIEHGILNNKNLEIGFLPSVKQLKHAQMQGSVYLKFPDGEMKLLGWDGTNRTSRNAEIDSIPTKSAKKSGKTSRDESNYVFFRPMKSLPTGAISQPLSEGWSLSVDPDIIPLGACLLAEFPPLDGRSAPEFRLLLAQDVGGGIQGSGRFDLYCGPGEAFTPISRVNELAKIWLLLPKKPTN